MPSPTWRTVPTSERSVSTSYCSIRCLRIEVISSGRSFTGRSLLRSGSGYELAAEAVDPAAHARVDAQRAGLEDHPADQVGVDRAARLDGAAGGLLDLRDDRAGLVVGERVGGRQLDLQAALLAVDDRLELLGDRSQLAGASLRGDQADEVPDDRVATLRHLVEDARLGARVELRVGEEGLELRARLERVRQLRELVARHVDAVLVARGLEQRARVHAVRDRHQLFEPSRAEKSRPCTASCTRRRWSSASSTLPTTRSVASIVRSATSLRIWPIARAVSASICFRVSSSRRCRSVSASCFARSICASATLRASARMSADSERACPRIARFCSSRSRASLRALSASSTAWRIRSRRSSIVFWMGPNANFLSTKNVIANAISVQIMRPGTTLIRSFEDSAASRPTMLRRGRRRAGRRSGRRTRRPR